MSIMHQSLMSDDEHELPSILIESQNTPPSENPFDHAYNQVDDYDYDYDDQSSDYTIPSIEELDAKSRILDQYKESVHEMRKRLIWDLTFALKRNLCSQNNYNDCSTSFANIPIELIISKLEEENPQPSQWISFIMRHLLYYV